jgi:tetratricopeptide (TPR) repeat protein
VTKQSRKELLKHDDAFTVAAGQASTWFVKHRAIVLGSLGAVLALALGVIGAQAWGHSKSKEASHYFAEGWKLNEGRLKKAEGSKSAHGKAADGNTVTTASAKTSDANAPKNAIARGDADAEEEAEDEAEQADDRPQFDTNKDKWTAARAEFEKALNVTGTKDVGAMAAFMVGDLSDKLGEHDRAEKVFGSLRAELPKQDSLSFLAVERFAYGREAAGDPDGAIEALRELAADDTRFYADYAQMHQARLHLAKGDKDRAREMLQHIESEFPDSSLQDEVRAKLQELGGGVPVAQVGARNAPIDTDRTRAQARSGSKAAP